jgi:hypothetical protein
MGVEMEIEKGGVFYQKKPNGHIKHHIIGKLEDNHLKEDPVYANNGNVVVHRYWRSKKQYWVYMATEEVYLKAQISTGFYSWDK